MHKNKVLLLLILTLIIINWLGYLFFFRIDLTSDKRYTLSPATKTMISKLEDQVVIKVLLASDDLPGGFVRLKNAVNETLKSFKDINPNKLFFSFEDPLKNTNRKRAFDELIAKGLQPTNIFDTQGGKKTENLIFPYALIRYKDQELPVQLLKANQSQGPHQQLNQAYENLEYELGSAISKLSNTQKKRIGLLTDFTTRQPVSFAGMINTLQEFYDLFILDTKSSLNFDQLDAIIIPKPELPVDDSTKFKLDQYLMKGGNLLFFVDGLKVDEIGLEGTFAHPLNVNLDDMFFQYGVRVNKNIVKDGLNAAVIPLVVGNMGDSPNIQPIPYRYFPLINNFGKSLITKNIDLVYTRFPASIDTVSTGGILSKNPLLLTSAYTKVLNAPAIITYNEARIDTDPDEYSSGEKALAYLVEGEFHSLYRNRLSMGSNFLKKSSHPGKILVCSDADLIVSEIDPKTNNPLPMGYDRFSKHLYGNTDFLLNAMSYMIEEEGLIIAKAKSIGLRPLNKLKIRDDRVFWQALNLGLPLLLLLVYGIARYYFLRKKYQH